MADPVQFVPDDDMNDKAEIDLYEKRPELLRLVQALTFCDRVIEPVFRATDSAAIAAQRTDGRYANAAAWFGVMAVLLAIIQLSRLGAEHLHNWMMPFGAWVLPCIELLFAAAAVAVALAGLGGRKQQKWFLTRYQAERLRLLKFDVLTHPHLWSGDEEVTGERRQVAEAEVEAIAGSLYSALESWISEGTVPEVLGAPQMTEAEWEEFRSYYQQKRLLKQTRYFVARLNQNVKSNDRSRIWPSVFFFGSIAFVMAHFCIELAVSGGEGENSRVVETLTLVAAAALPSFGAVIRAFRGVLEFARNASRCESTHHVLLKLAIRLRNAGDAAAVFREIGFCEQALESDLRDWLRLMVESEWFG